MWLTYNAEKEKIQLPVLPETFNTNNGSSNDSMDITGLGEIIIMQSRPALQFSFSSFFPAARFPGLQVSSITKPLELVQKINTWKASKKPVHFIATACGVDLYCSIEKFNYSEEGGDPGTYQYDITLKEYREITVRQVKVDIPSKEATVEKEEARVDNSVQPKTYTVKSGDCLWNIAKQFYGSGSDYTKIYNANKGTIGGNPNLIYPGQVLTLP
jgi:nucleoid-associated protein YgaU